MDFKRIVYERLDMELIHNQLKALISKMESVESKELCFEILRNFNDLQVEVRNEWSFVGICHHLNVKDTFYKEENEYYTKQMPVFNNLKAQFYTQLLESPFKDDIQNEWGKLLLQIAKSESLEANPVFIESNQKLGKLFYDFFQLRVGATIHVRGKSYTMKGINSLFNSPDRQIRKEALDGFWKIIEEHAPSIDAIFREIVDIRQGIAQKLGHENYVELAYQYVKKYDYSPADMAQFRLQVRQYVTPILNKINEKKLKRMGYKKRHYYDTVSFKTGNAKLKTDLETTIPLVQQTFQELSAETSELFDSMVENNWIDFSNNPNKLQGSNFCGFFPKFHYPFLNVFFYGNASNITTIFHEFGHAFQKLQSLEVGEKWCDYFWAAPDIAEIHSTTMEYLTWNWYPLFFGEDTQKFRYSKLTKALEWVIYASLEDEFQHFIYENPNASPELLGTTYHEIQETYIPYVSHSDHAYLNSGGRWRSSTNVASAPFHYISYALSTICALQFWKKSQENFDETWQDYLRLCKVGGSVGFKEALQIANLKSPFEVDTLKEVVGFVEDWLNSVDTSEW